MTMRVSATTLESFRLYLTGDWMSEAELLATIRGEFVPTRPVQVGQAWGSILEYPDKHRMLWGGYESGGIRFSDSAVEPMLALIDRSGVFEAKATIDLDDVTLVAKADHLLGAHLSEFKATLGTYDPDKYFASCQWRVMTLIFEPQRITYRVACVSDDEDAVTLRSIENMDLYPYSALEADCRSLVREFVRYVRLRKLDGLLRERQMVAEVGV